MPSPKNNLKLLILLISMGAFGSASAIQASWLEQGTELLKQVQNPTAKTSTSPANLSTDDMQKAFKQALSQGSETVVKKLGVLDGFNKDPKVHIPLPSSLKSVQSTLGRFGMSGMMDDVELRINRAAEAATPQAKALFLNAIQDMRFEDVKKIYSGPQDSATQYLKSKTAASLKTKMAPIVEKSMNEAGAIKAYDQAISKYKSLPMVPDVKANLLNHVVEQAMNGMFYYIGQEEASIRKDPIKQSTALLKKVFGGQ